jgi:hypothetical protein
MIRTFLLEQDANSALVNSIALTELNLNDIENAGLREVLQTPHASYNSWTILEALLQPSGD